VAEVTDPTSPLHPGRIGLRVAPIYRSARIPDAIAANSVALVMLWNLGLPQDTVGVSAVRNPLLDSGDVVSVTEDRTGTDDRYWLGQVTHPVTQGALSFSASRVVPLVALP
jgi:hypothetical protein